MVGSAGTSRLITARLLGDEHVGQGFQRMQQDIHAAAQRGNRLVTDHPLIQEGELQQPRYPPDEIDRGDHRDRPALLRGERGNLVVGPDEVLRDGRRPALHMPGQLDQIEHG